MQLQQEITADIHHVLQIDSIQIQPEDNLIEHGLHSLAIMQLVDHFEKNITRRCLMQILPCHRLYTIGRALFRRIQNRLMLCRANSLSKIQFYLHG